MFTTKQKNLISNKNVRTSKTSAKADGGIMSGRIVTNDNPFLNFGFGKVAETKSGNGALKYSTSGNLFVDQFGAVAKYKSPRTFSDISADMNKLWACDQELTVKFVLYLRMITRQDQLPDGSKTKTTQRGAGLKHEGIVRMVWLAVNAPDVFASNLGLFITVGSWNDLIKMLSYDVQYNGWAGRILDWNFMGNVILAGLENPNTTNLIRKYLPQIKANAKCHTLEAQADNVIAKWICSLIFGTKTDETGTTYKEYRRLKTSGTAHQWQQLISQSKHNLVDFNTVAGRALALMVSGKYLKNHKLETKYTAWIETKPVAKFTGFPYELAQMAAPGIKQYQKSTINAQFNQLVEVAKKGLVDGGIRPISVLDCSGSMGSPMYIGSGQVGKLKSIEVAFSSAIFFNEMMNQKSPFYNTYLQFSNQTSMCKFIGHNFVDKYLTSPRNGWGGTNFQTVFDFFVDFKRRNPTIDEALIPNFITIFSDGEFNGVAHAGNFTTNIEAGRAKLAQYYSKEFCENFGLCFIDLPNTFYSNRPATKFETFGNCKNVFYFSGYDLSPLGFLFGVEGQRNKETGEIVVPKTAEELFMAAMNQEVLNMVTV